MHLKAITLFGCKFKCVILFKIGNFAIRRSFLPTLILVIILIFLSNNINQVLEEGAGMGQRGKGEYSP